MITSDPIHLALCKSLPPAGSLQPVRPRAHAPIEAPWEEHRDASVCASKNQYPTAQVAAYHAAVLESVDPTIKLWQYKCRNCHKWHLTSQLP